MFQLSRIFDTELTKNSSLMSLKVPNYSPKSMNPHKEYNNSLSQILSQINQNKEKKKLRENVALKARLELITHRNSELK